MATLFTVPIRSGGTFTCTEPASKVYLLTFLSPPDNRLTTAFIDAFLLSLDIIQHRYPVGVLITTSGIPKFYSNGLDLKHVQETPGFWAKWLFPLFKRLLTYPMPTVALMNGHAFAGGLIVATYHDYRVQNPSKGFLCMNEVLFGAVLQTPMTSIFRQKCSPATFRDLLLEGKRYGAPAAIAAGLVDCTGGLNEALALVKERSLVAMGSSGVYGALKEDMYRETLGLIGSHDANVAWREGVEALKAEEGEKALAGV